MSAPAALYFPYTDISPARLARALLFFQEIILYRLPEDQPGPDLARAVELGLVRMIEVDFIDDKGEIRRIMADFSSWRMLWESRKKPDRQWAAWRSRRRRLIITLLQRG